MTVISVFGYTAQLAGASVVEPEFYDITRNVTCSELAGEGQSWRELKIEAPDDGPLVDGTYTDGTLTVTITQTHEGKTFDWVSENHGVDAVYVKAGTGGSYLYRYDPPREMTADNGLTTPGSGKSNGISHISFCYDRGTKKTTTTSGETSTTKGDTTTTIPGDTTTTIPGDTTTTEDVSQTTLINTTTTMAEVTTTTGPTGTTTTLSQMSTTTQPDGTTTTVVRTTTTKPDGTTTTMVEESTTTLGSGDTTTTESTDTTMIGATTIVDNETTTSVGATSTSAGNGSSTVPDQVLGTQVLPFTGMQVAAWLSLGLMALVLGLLLVTTSSRKGAEASER